MAVEERPRSTRASTATPWAAARCSIASSIGIAPACLRRQRWERPTACGGLAAGSTGIRVAPSARARRSAASTARREISVPVKGRRIRWTASGRVRERRCGAGSGEREAAAEAEQQRQADDAALDHASPP